MRDQKGLTGLALSLLFCCAVQPLSLQGKSQGLPSQISVCDTVWEAEALDGILLLPKQASALHPERLPLETQPPHVERPPPRTTLDTSDDKPHLT